MKVTESMHLERTNFAVNKLRELLVVSSVKSTLVYRFSVARRFSIAYYAFMSYLIERMGLIKRQLSR